jgi:hypothetical protein
VLAAEDGADETGSDDAGPAETGRTDPAAGTAEDCARAARLPATKISATTAHCQACRRIAAPCYFVLVLIQTA